MGTDSLRHNNSFTIDVGLPCFKSCIRLEPRWVVANSLLMQFRILSLIEFSGGIVTGKLFKVAFSLIFLVHSLPPKFHIGTQLKLLLH